jgi:hypothetical protein
VYIATLTVLFLFALGISTNVLMAAALFGFAMALAAAIFAGYYLKPRETALALLYAHYGVSMG